MHTIKANPAHSNMCIPVLYIYVVVNYMAMHDAYYVLIVMASEVASPLSVAVVILSGSLELDVTVSVAAFSWVNDTATEGEGR